MPSFDTPKVNMSDECDCSDYQRLEQQADREGLSQSPTVVRQRVEGDDAHDGYIFPVLADGKESMPHCKEKKKTTLSWTPETKEKQSL